MYTISAYTTTNRRIFIALASDLDRALWHLDRLTQRYGPWTLASANVCRERETTPLAARAFGHATTVVIPADTFAAQRGEVLALAAD